MKTYLSVDSLSGTAAHIRTLQTKLERLTVLRDEAWQQLLAAADREYRAGALDDVDLLAMLEEMRGSYGVGFTRLWNETMPWTHAQLPHRAAHASRYRPNGPGGNSWVGTWPVVGLEPHPADRVPVVYVFYDEANEPVYVGSTERFMVRMKAHKKDPKKLCVARWMACQCADREEAYRLEEKLLAEHQPRLNGRKTR